MAAITVGIGVFMIGSSLASAVFAQTITQINGCSNTVCKNIAITWRVVLCALAEPR